MHDVLIESVPLIVRTNVRTHRIGSSAQNKIIRSSTEATHKRNIRNIRSMFHWSATNTIIFAVVAYDRITSFSFAAASLGHGKKKPNKILQTSQNKNPNVKILGKIKTKKIKRRRRSSSSSRVSSREKKFGVCSANAERKESK